MQVCDQKYNQQVKSPKWQGKRSLKRDLAQIKRKKESEKDERLVDRFVLSNIYVTFDYLQTFLDANRAGVLSKTKATTTSVSSIIEFL